MSISVGSVLGAHRVRGLLIAGFVAAALAGTPRPAAALDVTESDLWRQLPNNVMCEYDGFNGPTDKKGCALMAANRARENPYAAFAFAMKGRNDKGEEVKTTLTAAFFWKESICATVRDGRGQEVLRLIYGPPKDRHPH